MLDVEIARSCIVVSKNKGDERSTLGNGMKKWARKEARQLGEEKRKEEGEKEKEKNNNKRAEKRNVEEGESKERNHEKRIKSTRNDRARSM